MKTILGVGAAAFLLGAAGLAVAGDCCGSKGGDCCGKAKGSDGGYSCQNSCPLAQTANKHRSTGTEAAAALACQVAKNLARI